jgi:hypothetical protein
MKAKVSELRKFLREYFEKYLENVDRERQEKRGYKGASDGAGVTYGDLPEGVEEEGAEMEEGVSQSKRAKHGYDLEEPADYTDVPGEGLGKVEESKLSMSELLKNNK